MADDEVSRSRGPAPEPQVWSWWERLWSPFWAVPLACTVAAVAAGLLLPELDARIHTELPYVFPGGADGARAVLGTIAGAMISVTGLVFSLTIVVLQLASSQFTPRLLGTFLQSRQTQATLGSFIASFVFSLTVLRSVRGGSESDTFVPQLSVTVSYLLVLTSVALFMAFMHHITTAIQVSHVISRVGDQTAELVSRQFPAVGAEITTGTTWSPRPGAARHDVLVDDRHGHLVEVDEHALVSLAAAVDAVLVVPHRLGDFVVQGQVLAQVWGASPDTSQQRTVNEAFSITTERSARKDVAFGIRQLVDIAERALSPGINDPTTAVQVVDELHRILRPLVQRTTPSPYLLDASGGVRLVLRNVEVSALLTSAVEEIAHYGRESVQVPRRLVAMLDDLELACLEAHRPTVRSLRSHVVEISGQSGGVDGTS